MKLHSFIYSFTFFFAFALTNSSCKQGGSGSATGNDEAAYQQQVMSVEEIERSNPSRFLEAGGTYKENFWGDLMKVHGTVENKATVANYKDVVIEITFYSETETVLDTKQYTVYDYFPAHSTKPFDLKVSRPNACKKLGWTAIGGVAY
jgi:hypothetical protein